MHETTQDDLISSARDQAVVAAEAASVRVEQLRTPAQAAASVELLAAIWRVPVEQPPIDLSTVTALTYGHGSVSGAFHDQELVGVSIGFVVGDELDTLHSHITGVRDDHARSGVGAALKLQQRWWAVEHGLSSVTWTFDPLIGRNAGLNLRRLGARLESYLINFYGPMADGRNRGQPSDRAYVRWDLHRSLGDRRDLGSHLAPTALLTMADDGAPEFRTEDVADAVAGLSSTELELIIPADIEAIRETDLELALAWRLALRETLGPLLAAGCQVIGYRGGAGERTGRYLLAAADDHASISEPERN